MVALAQWTQARKEEKEDSVEDEDDEQEENETVDTVAEPASSDSSSSGIPSSLNSRFQNENDIFRSVLAERSDEDTAQNLLEVTSFLELIVKRENLEYHIAEEVFKSENPIGEVLYIW